MVVRFERAAFLVATCGKSTVRDDWVTVEQAAQRVNRSRPTIYRWVADGKVATFRPGRMLWLSLPDLLEAERAARPGRPPSTTRNQRLVDGGVRPGRPRNAPAYPD